MRLHASSRPPFRPRTLIRGALVGILVSTACDNPSEPTPPNVQVTTSPQLVASFASLGGTHAITAQVTDTLGAALTDAVSWSITPANAGVSVDEGNVVVSAAATARDYLLRAAVQGVADTTILRVLPRPVGKLVFTATVGTDRQVFVKDFATDGDAVQVTTGASASGGLAVTATGTIFVSRGQLPNVDLFRMNIDGSGSVNLTNDPGASNQGPAVHPVTGQIYFSRRSLAGGTGTQVFRIGPDGSGLTEVTSGSQGKVQPAISPNGLLLSWTEQYPGFNQEIVTASIEGGNPLRLTDRTGIDGSSFWISNTRLAWGAAATTAPDIFLADAPGGANAVNLTNREGASLQPSAGCSPGTITMLRRTATETAMYQLDLATALAVRYTLPTTRDIGFARRLC